MATRPWHALPPRKPIFFAKNSRLRPHPCPTRAVSFAFSEGYLGPTPSCRYILPLLAGGAAPYRTAGTTRHPLCGPAPPPDRGRDPAPPWARGGGPRQPTDSTCVIPRPPSLLDACPARFMITAVCPPSARPIIANPHGIARGFNPATRTRPTARHRRAVPDTASTTKAPGLAHISARSPCRGQPWPHPSNHPGKRRIRAQALACRLTGRTWGKAPPQNFTNNPESLYGPGPVASGWEPPAALPAAVLSGEPTPRSEPCAIHRPRFPCPCWDSCC